MDLQQFTIAANKFQSVLDAPVLNERGNQLGFAERERLITPFRFGLSVVASMATEQVSSIADLHRQFNDLWELESHYRSFYNQLVKDTCPEFFRLSLCDIMSKLSMKCWALKLAKPSANSTALSFKMAVRLPSTMPSLTCSRAASAR